MSKKKVIPLLGLLLLMVIGTLGFSADEDENVTYNKKNNTFSWITETAKAAKGVRYKFQVLGFKTTMICENQKEYDIYFYPTLVKSTNDTINGVDMVTDEFATPLSGTKDSIHEIFMRKYPDTADQNNINSFFAEATEPLRVNSVLGIIENGKAVGEMNVNDRGQATFSGRVYHTEETFLNCGIGWGVNTRRSMKDFFEIKLSISPQDVGTPTPKITRKKADGTQEVKDVHTFKEGEPITLNGAETYFPAQTKPKEFHWTYRKVGESTFKPLESKDAGSPFKNSLPVGEYEVELEATAIYFRNWDKKESPKRSLPENKAQTKIVIEANAEPTVLVSVQSPDKVKYEAHEIHKNIPVTLNATVSGIDEKNIKEIKLKVYDGLQAKEQTFAPATKLMLPHNFGILHDQDKHVYFYGKATVVLKNGKILESNLGTSKTYIYKQSPENLPPVPILELPKEIQIGSAYANGIRSYDIDGYITAYYFEVPALGFYQSSEAEETKDRSNAFIHFPYPGTFDVTLGVKDNDGAMSFTSERITVTPPCPVLQINVDGFLKENRKVTFNAYNQSEFLSPISGGYYWEITPISEGIAQESIKMVGTSGQKVDVLFKKKGQYLVTVKAKNSFGVDGERTIVVDIVEDVPPVIKIAAPKRVYRNGTGQATINVYDNSYSLDGDYIGTRMWFYRFDSNNDGNFNDEKWIKGKETTDFMDRAFSFEANHVGNYEVRVFVTEIFGQETLPQFLVDSDYKKAEGKCVTEVDNIKPSVSFDAYSEKKVDLAIITDYEEEDLLKLESELNQFMHDSFDDYINVKFDVISEKKYLGRYLHENAQGYDGVDNIEAPKYQVANWNGLIEYSDHSYEVTYQPIKLFNAPPPTKTIGVFPSRIQASYAYNPFSTGGLKGKGAILWHLENGEVYFLGTNSNLDASTYYTSIDLFTLKPIKILSDVEQIEGGDNRYYMRLKNGDIYAMGNTFSSLQNYHVQSVSYDFYLNTPNYRFLGDFVFDPEGQAKSSPQFVGDYISGYFAPVKLKDAKNAVYLWANGSALVYKQSNGDWYGFGQGLNAFGLYTGFNNSPKDSWHISINEGLYRHTWDSTGVDVAMNRLYYYDNIQQMTKLDNLTKLNNSIGGIEWLEPNKVYGKNGKAYLLNTSSVWEWVFGGKIPNGIRVTSGNFSYKENGTWQEQPKLERKGGYLWATQAQINASGVPLTLYGDSFKDFTSSVKTVRSESGAAPKLQPEIKYLYLNDKTDTLFDYKGLAYNVVYTYTHRKAVQWEETVGRWDDEYTQIVYGYEYYYKSSLGSKVLEVESQKQAGWKTYGVDPSKIENLTYRDGAQKYLLYLGEKDSFRKVSPDFLEVLKNNSVATRVSTESQWVDRPVDINREVNLRHLLNATPEGKLYGADALTQMLQDIKNENEVVRSAEGAFYVIVEEDSVEFANFYRDLEQDPKYSDRNYIEHDETVFDNAMGLSIYDKKVVTQPRLVLDKVGRYDLTYSAVDNPVKTDERFKEYRKESNQTNLVIYAHRRPFAVYELEWDYDYDRGIYTSTWQDASYDLDHLYNDSRKGIREHKVSYRKAEEGSPWISGVPNNLYPGTYELRYKVKDMEGAWSKEVFSTFTLEKDPPMQLKAQLESAFDLMAIPASEALQIINLETLYHKAHDIRITLHNENGDAIHKVALFLYEEKSKYNKNGFKHHWVSIPYQLDKGLKDGCYYIEVKAREKTEPFKEKTVILPFGVKTPIEVEGEVPELNTGEKAKVRALANVYADKVVLRAFIGTPSETVYPLEKEVGSLMWQGQLTVPSSLKEGLYNFEFIAWTASGNKAVHSVVQKVQGITIEHFDVSGAWHHWNGGRDLLGTALPNQPHRFLSYEEVTFTAIIEGEPERVEIRLSKELEAMTYTNALMQTYSYKTQFGYEVEFPLELVKTAPNTYQIQYILPLADHTLSWSNERMRKPYKAVLYATKNGTVKTAEIDDIHITGNVYDLIQVQPNRP